MSINNDYDGCPSLMNMMDVLHLLSCTTNAGIESCPSFMNIFIQVDGDPNESVYSVINLTIQTITCK